MDEIRAMFLRQSLKDCEETFAEALKRRDAPTWDYLVVTAASESQAAAYRAQIDARRKAGQLPKTTRYLVIPDPGGRRVGSGGATLNVLSEIARLEGGDTPFSMKRILVLHSGGDSQRIPQYSALGKLFARVPRALPDGRASTLFDEFCIALSCVQFAVMMVLSTVCAFTFETVDFAALGECTFYILYIGILSSAGGHTLQILAQKDGDPTVVSLLLSLESFFAVVCGAIILHERMSGREYLGCALMLTAVLLSQLPEKTADAAEPQKK